MLVQLDDTKAEAPVAAPPYVHPDLVSGLTAQYYDNYLITATDGVVVDGMHHGRGLATALFEVQGAVYSAYLDDKVCDLCESLDGTQVAVPSEAYDTLSPKQHRCCRCLWVLVEKSEADFEPDRDPYAGVRAAAEKADKSIGDVLVGSAHANPTLQQRFAAETQKAREELAERRTVRAAKAIARMREKSGPRPVPPPTGIRRRFYGKANDDAMPVERIWSELALVPEGFRVAMEAAGYEIRITSGHLTDVPPFTKSKNVPAPGWDGLTWDVLGGGQEGKIIVLAYGPNVVKSSCASDVLHEYSHALIDQYHLLEDPNYLEAFASDFKLLEAKGEADYYHEMEPHEALAERLSWYFLGGSFRQHLLDVSPSTYTWIANWIGEIAPP